MTALPPPLTPPKSDLTDFGWMPLEIVRFRGSDMLTEDGDVVVAALMLWTAAWHETPAASLTDDDKTLAKAAGYGRAVSAWLEVKDRALRGFVKCSDGRLYHPVVARLANKAWRDKVEQRYRTEVGRIKKHNERHADRQISMPSFDAFAQHFPALIPDCRDDTAQLSQGHLPLVPATEGGLSLDCPGEIASKGESRESKGRVKGDSIEKQQQPPTPLNEGGGVDLLDFLNLCAQAGAVSINPSRTTVFTRELDIVKRWRDAGIPDEIVLTTIERRTAETPDQTISSLLFFDANVLKAFAIVKGKNGHGAHTAWTPDRKAEYIAALDHPELMSAYQAKWGQAKN